MARKKGQVQCCRAALCFLPALALGPLLSPDKFSHSYLAGQKKKKIPPLLLKASRCLECHISARGQKRLCRTQRSSKVDTHSFIRASKTLDVEPNRRTSAVVSSPCSICASFCGSFFCFTVMALALSVYCLPTSVAAEARTSPVATSKGPVKTSSKCVWMETSIFENRLRCGVCVITRL